ncbi:MAG: hypothetical protein HY235_09705 [Acidobacteria bacterium]|nr:hypothetical protein [Acidobacteriota bacterium]
MAGAVETTFYMVGLAPVILSAPLFAAGVLGWNAVPLHTYWIAFATY